MYMTFYKVSHFIYDYGLDFVKILSVGSIL